MSHKREAEKINRARQIAWIAGIFTALVSLLLIFNYLQIQKSDPLESDVLKLLVERLSADPDNHTLIEEIRQFDLLARKAYFNSLWQIRTGAYLLLFGAIVLVAALRMYFNLRFAIDKPSHENLKERQKRHKTQLWIAAAGACILMLAAISAFFSADHLKQYETGKQMGLTPASDIEQLDIVKRADAETPAGDVETEGPDGLFPDEEGTDTDQPSGPMDQDREPSPALRLTAESVGRNHNAFRGPWGNGISPRQNIPDDWDGSSGKNIVWKTEIPLHGFNSPVLWGDRLFLSGANNTKRVVYCLDRLTGRILWEHEANNIAGSPASPPRTTDDTGLAAPTLTVDGERVFAIFGTGDLLALDLGGNRLWARNLGVPANHYGHSSSLLTWDGKVFVQYDTQDGSRLLAIDAASGQTTWETRRSSGVSWASPIMIPRGDSYQIVLSANPNVAAYDVTTGREVWSVNCMSGEVGPSPAYGGGMVYAANEYAKLVAISPASGQIVWEDNYYLPEVSSPVYHNGLLFVATSYAVFACFDATNGDFLWEFDADNGFYSSPLVADGKIYIFDMEGKAYIFKPGREANLIASPELGEKVYATPVMANGHIYIRGNKHVYCIGK